MIGFGDSYDVLSGYDEGEHSMRLRNSHISTILAVIGLIVAPFLCAVAQAQDSALTFRNGETNIHILPTVDSAAGLAAVPELGSGPLVYHAGGVIMPTATTYAIFWNPPKLQDGTPTSIPAHYQAVLAGVLADYAGHGIGSNNTQYYQTIGATTTYIQNAGKLGGVFVDTSPYPPSGCPDAATPHGCITDVQAQAEIKKVIAKKHWKQVISNMFLLFIAPGEGTCVDAAGTSCSYTFFCAYHGFIISGSKTIIYGNEPFGEPSVCQISVPSPNSDPAADTAATAATHELTEAITDPELNAWFTSGSPGEEIGDLCAYDYGSLTWDGGMANQMWNGHFYLVQQEYDNHVLCCVQVGPLSRSSRPIIAV
jgi:hypothetical protein